MKFLALPASAAAGEPCQTGKAAPPHGELVCVKASAAEGVTERRGELVACRTTEWDLPAFTLWLCHATFEGRFVPAEMMAVPELGGAELSFTLFPVAKLRATLQLSEPGRVAPNSLDLRLRQTPERYRGLPSAPEPKLAGEQRLSCPVREGAVECLVPALTLDFDLKAKTFVASYFWSVRFRPGEVLEVGKVALEGGSSVAGAVSAEGGLPAPGDAVVELWPATQGLALPPSQRPKPEPVRARVTDRGFFQLKRVPPGSYRLVASAAGYADSSLAQVPVEPEAETRLRQSLELRRPVRLALSLVPPRDAYGGVWQVALWRPDPTLGQREQVAGGPATEDGRFERTDLAPGSYQAAISSSRGERLWQEEIRLAPPFEERTIAIEQLWVEGQIRLGQEPLAAELVFGTRAGSESVRLWSDEEGRFEGVLPRSGRWTVAVSARSPQVATHVQVEVEEASAGGSRRLDILLPATEVRGRVLDPEGRPVAGALVQVLDATGPASNAVRSGEDGSYELRGIAPATIQLQAGASVRGKAMESLPRSLDVAEDRRLTGIDLQLMEREIVQGKVLSSRGPVAGARVSLYPAQGSPGSAQATGADVVTAADGSFATGLPAGSRELEVMVMPPGFALTIRRVVRAPGQPLILAVEELGGTLTLLGSPQEARADGLGALLTLWKDGIPLGEPVLRPWAMLNGGGWDAPSLRLPAMPPGHYQVCWLSGEELARQVLRGYLLTPDPAQCPAGDLAQGGELVLEIPGARS